MRPWIVHVQIPKKTMQNQEGKEGRQGSFFQSRMGSCCISPLLSTAIIQGDTILRSLILSAKNLPTWSTSRNSGVRSPAHVFVIQSMTSSPLASLENSFGRQLTHAVTGSSFSLEKTGYSILLNSHFTKMIFSLCPRLCPNQDLCLKQGREQGQTFPHGPAST